MTPIAVAPYTENHAPELAAAVQESHAELEPWMPWAVAGYSLLDAEAWVRTVSEGHVAKTMFDFAISGPDGRYAGGCGLNQISWASRVANLGYWVRSSCTGQGIAPAAVRLVVSWAFENTLLNRLEVVVAVDNIRSKRVAEKAGAHYDGLLQQRLMVANRATDAHLFSFVRAR